MDEQKKGKFLAGFPKELTKKQYEGKVKTIFDLTNAADWYKADKFARDFCFRVGEKRPKLFEKAVETLMYLGLSGIWKGHYLCLDRIITIMLEAEGDGRSQNEEN